MFIFVRPSIALVLVASRVKGSDYRFGGRTSTALLVQILRQEFTANSRKSRLEETRHGTDLSERTNSLKIYVL